MSDVGVVGSVEPEVLARLLAETDHGQDVEARLAQAVADSAAAAAAAPTAAQTMAQLSAAPADPTATLLGYHAPGDGGHGNFVWSDVPAVDDRGTVINPSAPSGANPDPKVFVQPSAARGWRRIRKSQEINVKWFGARGNRDSDDTQAIQTALKAVTFEASEVYFPFGHYSITAPLYLSAQRGVVVNPTHGIRLRGEGSTNIGYPTSLNWYGPAGGTLLNVTGYGHRISNLRFLNDVTGGFGSPVIAANGVALGSLAGTSDSLTSDVRFEKCRFQGFRHGVALDPDSQCNHNIEQCAFVDCWFDAYDTGLWIRGGQPFNTRVDDCVFTGNDPTGANRSPHGCGIRVGGPTLSGGSLWISRPNFTYITYGLKLEQQFQVSIRDIDSENCKRLFSGEAALGDSTFIIEGGRCDTSAVVAQRTGYMMDAKDQIDATNISYIKLKGGGLSVKGITFAPSFTETPNFQIEMDASVNIESENNIYPNLRPFNRSGSSITDGKKRFIGRTFSHGDLGVHTNPLFAPGGYVYDSCPTLNGAENGGGSVTISDASTFADVSLDRPEMLVVLADPTSAAYDVALNIELVSGHPVISVPYVSAKTVTGFRVNLSAAPGVGSSLRVHYKLSR